MGGLESVGEGVHAADVGVEEVGGLVGLAAALGVEVEATGGEPAHLQHAEHDVGGEVEVARELVGVPAEKGVATVGVDRAEGPGGDGDFHFMLHGVTGQGGVVGFQVELEVVEQAVFAEEVEAGGGVGVVLVRGGFARLGLDVELALESDLLGVVDGEVKQRREVVEFALHVGVEQGGVAFATAPEDVAFAAEAVGGFKGVLHLRGSVGEDVGRRRGACTVGIAWMGEEAGGAPEELFPGGLLLGFEGIDDLLEVLVRLGEGRAFRGDVAVVEAVVVDGGFFEELEEHRHAVERVGEGLGAIVPGHQGGGRAEGIGEAVAHDVPVGGGEAEVLGHGLVTDLFSGVVMAEGEGVVARRAFVADHRDLGEMAHDGGLVWLRKWIAAER